MSTREASHNSKVLYISDSLGTPIHPRGIFNFSVSLVEILRNIGLQVDLVVESAPSYNPERVVAALARSAPDAANAVRLSEVYRYFSQGRFEFRWSFGRVLRFMNNPGLLSSASRSMLTAVARFRRSGAGAGQVRVRNQISQLDFVPPSCGHLTLFDNLVAKPKFYSTSMSNANLGLAPPSIDAQGYDLVVVDTPHFITVKGVRPERILTVLHDLIPLRDPTMDLNWRNLFIRKLTATLALRGAMVFVSRYTQNSFHDSFPGHAAAREFIVHPAIRSGLSKEKPGRREARGARSWFGGFPPPPGFDERLPFFVTATSDEPRKNIGLIVAAFYRYLRGRANIVILGQIDSYRYDPGPNANVHFPGYVSDAEKIAYFRNAQGVVFASLSEGFGIPVVEGATMGLPVVCSEIDVFREVARDEAYYFDPRNPASLARAVDAVLADPEGSAERAEAMRQAVQARFSQAAVGKAVRAILGELGLDAPRRRALAPVGEAPIGAARVAAK